MRHAHRIVLLIRLVVPGACATVRNDAATVAADTFRAESNVREALVMVDEWVQESATDADKARQWRDARDTFRRYLNRFHDALVTTAKALLGEK